MGILPEPPFNFRQNCDYQPKSGDSCLKSPFNLRPDTFWKRGRSDFFTVGQTPNETTSARPPNHFRERSLVAGVELIINDGVGHLPPKRPFWRLETFSLLCSSGRC